MERRINKLRIVKWLPKENRYTHITTVFGDIETIGDETIVTMSSSSNVALNTYGERNMEIGEAFLIVE